MRSAAVLNRPIPPGLAWILAAIASMIFGHLLQSTAHLNHDVSWIAHSSRWLLEGRRFGVDVIDVNPPLIWWLSLPAALLVKLQLASEPLAVRLVFWIYFLVSAYLLFEIVARFEQRERAAAIGWRLSFIVVATLAPAASFGQREYVSVLFAMPYLAAAALRLQGPTNLRKTTYAAVGLLAGIGFALKPYFLAVPLLIEVQLIARLGWRSVIRVEAIALAVTGLIYGLLVVTIVPQYLSFTIPLLRSVYWAFDTSNFEVVLARYRIVSEPFIYGALIALLARCWTRQHLVLLLGGLGFSASYFIQAKGFVYHAYPILLCALAFLGVSVASGVSEIWNGRIALARPLVLALISSILLLTLPSAKRAHDLTVDWYVQYNTTWGEIGRYRETIIGLINKYAPTRQSYFMAFSTHPYPGFPSASYTEADWSSRSATQGIVAAYARRDELVDATLRSKIVRAADLQRRMVIEDFELRPPSIVLLDRAPARLGMNGRQFDDLAFYLEEPLFRRIWSSYVERPPFGPLRIFVHRDQAAGQK